VNQTALDFRGLQLSDVAGKLFGETPWWDISVGFQEQLRVGIAQAAQGQFVRIQVQHRAENGTVEDIDLSLTPIKDHTGTVIQIIPEGRRITELARAQDRLRQAHVELERLVHERTSESAEAIELLRESEERLQAMLDHSPAPIWFKDLQGRYLDANAQFERIFDRTCQDIVGKTDQELFPPEQAAAYRANDLEVLKTGRPLQFEEVALQVDGPHLNIVTKFLLRHPDGDPYAVCGIATDISDRKRVEDEVRRSEMFLNSILDNLPLMIFVKEARDLRFIRLNQAGEDLLGYLRGELMGKNDYDFFPRDEADFFTGKDREVLASGRLLDIPEEPILTRSGEVRYLHTKKIPIVGKDGAPEYLLGISEDITDRKLAEEALRLAKFSIERAADAVYWIDPQAKILDVNEAASLMLGYSREELCAMTVHDLNPDFQAEGWPAFWAETQRRGTMIVETFHRAKNGRLIPIEVSVNYISYEGKEYHCAFVRDITERKKAEEALHQSQRELQRHRAQLEDLTSKLFAAQDNERQRIARDLHDDFSQRLAALVLDVVSLEQQSPLTPELTAKLIEPVREQLEQLSDDLHNLAYRLHPSLVEHAGLRPAIEDHLHHVMQRTDLRIALKVKDLPSEIPLDWSTCLFRVVQESLQNIVKHAKATDVRVTLRGSPKGIGLSVTDNGTGFDTSDKGLYGNGLGLTSMQERVRLLRGYLRVHSRPFEGTKVCAWIPFKEGEQ
jgi:PAS domain S-box-containing protein